MRTVVKVVADLDVLELKHQAAPEAAAKELIELLLRQERFIWPDHEPLTRTEILRAFDSYVTANGGSNAELPTDPQGHALVSHVRTFLGADPASSDNPLGLDLDPETQLKYNALRHALSILAQMPREENPAISTLERVIEDRQNEVFGLMFQTDRTFTFRLRYHNPEALKAATERLVVALAPRDASAIEPLVRASPTTKISGVRDRFNVEFRPVLMKTPAGELAQVGDVHPIGSTRGLVRYLSWRNPQRALLLVAIGVLVCDVVFQTFVPPAHVGNLNLTGWVGGTLGRVTTAAFTAFLFAVIVQYIALRARFTRRSAALIDWRTDPQSVAQASLSS
jgi:hypothetical protein